MKIFGTIVQLAVSHVFPSALNPRKNIDVVKLSELMRSVEAGGLKTPILVRPISNADYEVAAGHRRLLAFQKLGIETIPAIVREMSDEEFRETLLVENLQREDIDALDEADWYASLQESLGSAAAIAARVGKTIEHVTRVLKLCSLLPASRQSLAEKLIAIDHALLLARLAPMEQEKSLRYVLEPNVAQKVTTDDLIAAAKKRRETMGRHAYWEPRSVLELKKFIEREIRLELNRAPWNLADAELVASAGACTQCEKNTAQNVALFGDLAIEDAVCTDSECFIAKRDAFVQIQIASVKAAARESMVRLSWKQSATKPRWAKDGKGPDLNQVFKSGQWVEAKKGSCSSARIGVIVDFFEGYSTRERAQPGSCVSVCVAAGCEMHQKNWEVQGKSSDEKRYDRAAEEERRKKEEAACAEENKIRAVCAFEALKEVKKLPVAALRYVILEGFSGYEGGWLEKLDPGARKAIETAPIESVAFARAVAALSIFYGPFEVESWHLPEVGREEFLARLKSLGFDASGAWKQLGTTKVADKKAAVKVAAAAKKVPKKSPVKKAVKKAAAKKPAKKAAAKKGGGK